MRRGTSRSGANSPKQARYGRLYRRLGGRSGRFPRRLRSRRAVVLQGHRRGGGELQFPGPHHPRLLLPDALREAGRARGPAVLSRPDGAPGGARPDLSAAGEEPHRRHDRVDRGPPRRDRDRSRRHLGAPPERGALHGGRGGAREDASCERGLPDAPAQRAVGRRLAPALRGIRGRRRHACSPACARRSSAS